MYPHCFFNGTITKSNKPLIQLNDIAILRGYAAFDFLRIYNGVPFQLAEHLRRFKKTAKLMGLKNPFSDEEIKQALETLIKKNKVRDYQVRFVLTGGETKNGLFASVPIFYILFEKLVDLPDSLYQNGAKLITHQYQRCLPEAKNSNYTEAVLLQKRRLKEKAVEVLYISDNKVLEATTSNVFIIKNGVLYTPKNSVLKGITRKLVLDIAKRLKYKTVEDTIAIDELFDADEVFITATNKKVLPIVKIDSKVIGNGEVGKMTQSIMQKYEELIV